MSKVNEDVVCITGITGQTGSYAAEYWLDKGYKVYGLIRRASTFPTERIEHIYEHPNLKLIYGNLDDSLSIINFIGDIKPGYFLHLGAQSFVKASFLLPEETMNINAVGTIRCLEAIRKYSPNTRFLHSATSELYGGTKYSDGKTLNENSKMWPRSPYGCSKLAAYSATINYREAYNLFACNSLSFNHESSRRGRVFVTFKICNSAVRCKYGLQDKLVLGDTSSKRDWSHAKDIVDGMYKIITANKPDEYVLASGKSYSVQYFLERVFEKLDMDWREYVEIDEKYYRPSDVHHLCGDASKAKKELGWETKYSLDDIIDEMITYAEREAQIQKLVLEN